MGKVLVLSVAIVVGYTMGYRDARANPDHIATRVVQMVRTMFGATPTNDIDARMSRLEGKI